jgi:hypothetical protein
MTDLHEEIKELKKTVKLQTSAINILIAAYWKLYYDQCSFPDADAVRRIEANKELRK